MHNQRYCLSEQVFRVNFKFYQERPSLKSRSFLLYFALFSSHTRSECVTTYIFQFCKLPLTSLLAQVATCSFYHGSTRQSILKLLYFTLRRSKTETDVCGREKMANNKSDHQRKKQVYVRQRSLQRCEVCCAKGRWRKRK